MKAGSAGAATDLTSPAPGDHHAAAGSSGFGCSGPAYSIAGKLSSSNSSSLTVKEAAARLAAADGHAAVLAAAAALDKVGGVPGVGSYQVERQFPHPEGKLLYKPKPILKKQPKQQTGGSSSTAAKGLACTAGSSTAGMLQSSSRQLSSVRRVSWAE